jgi:hypothetical protein
MARAAFVLVLALRLVVDIATPLLPGAFHFDPAESIEARHAAFTGAAQVMGRPAPLPRTATADAVVPERETRPRIAPASWRPQPRRFDVPLGRDRAPESSEDH